MKVSEYARLHGISEQKVYRLLAQDRIPHEVNEFGNYDITSPDKWKPGKPPGRTVKGWKGS